ncbi:endonuclease [Bifidobacterium sp. ESL0728]|uniref:PaeR7I family type II restriction endonuclease n=1 Tax=Bifidobacterium sp. ESL0728 TaxID=2983220 RepID=UPI0023F8ECB7|nr:PaeR7I family type II restriction endonuclease [Bifidobacterium sp. ESL0728]WEV59071.1 endonuclease [Bifidobacterium sp. ESL0728]
MRDDVKAAVLGVYTAIDEAKEQQETHGQADQGNREGITSGKHLDKLAELIADDLVKKGFDKDGIHIKRGELSIPGWFRPTKAWDIVAFHENELVAAVELKTINSSFGNNANNRVEESLGSAVDAQTASSENLLGNSAVPPALGYVMLVRDCEDSRKITKPKSKFYSIDQVFNNKSYLDRFQILCTRLRQKNMYNAVWLAFVNPEKGTVEEPSKDLTYEKFIATLKASNDIRCA